MSADQCRRANGLGDPRIWEPFSVCSLRNDAEYGTRYRDALKSCCGTAPTTFFQCWRYCAVEESDFPTWMGCIEDTLNSTWGASCQRADQSPLLTETGPPPPAYTQPRPPEDYYSRFNTMSSAAPSATDSTSLSTLMRRESGATATDSAAGGKATVAGSGTANVSAAKPTDSKMSRSARSAEVSLGGGLCVLLIFSTLLI